MTLPDSAILNNLYITGTSRMDDPFEKQYINARLKENRIYDDKEVKSLPDILPAHPHFNEWQIRKKSCTRLIRFLKAKKKPLNILEIGCGNGWMSFQLAQVAKATVTGQDINFTELQQAARVFNANTRLRFVYGDVFSGVLRNRKFDVIVFAASIQYFSSFNKIIAFALDQLNKGGEIHILDTHFYAAEEIAAAKKRTETYFQSLGFPAMGNHYFHHSMDELNNFRYRLLFNPGSFKNRLLGRKDPFPWVCIKKA